MEDLRLDHFSHALGEVYEVEADGGPYPLRLGRAQELPNAIRAAGGFRLEWLGPEEPVLPQAIYTMRRDGEEYEIFIVPIASNAAGTRYEAIFS